MSSDVSRDSRDANGLAASVVRFVASFWPSPIRVSATERFRALVGAGVGILIAALVSHWLAGYPATPLVPWLVAPLGASAVLVFAVPSSPLAQPWAVIGGNTISALVGIACVHLLADPAVACAVAVGLAIAVMFSLRCLHPPGGATALLVVLLHATHFEFALFPVLANSLLLVLAGVFYNSLTGRRYPHSQAAPSRSPTPLERFSEADLDAAMEHYNQVLDVGRDDLTELLHYAELSAYQRNLGELRCADIMSTTVVTVEFGTPLNEAWALMRERKIKALPVIDKARHVVGIVTSADFMRHAGLDKHHGIGERLRALVLPTGSEYSDKPEVVGQIMTRKVRIAGQARNVIELVPLFSEGGHHHVPIIDDDKHLVGIITQSDLVRALYQAVRRAD